MPDLEDMIIQDQSLLPFFLTHEQRHKFREELKRMELQHLQEHGHQLNQHLHNNDVMWSLNRFILLFEHGISADMRQFILDSLRENMAYEHHRNHVVFPSTIPARAPPLDFTYRCIGKYAPMPVYFTCFFLWQCFSFLRTVPFGEIAGNILYCFAHSRAIYTLLPEHATSLYQAIQSLRYSYLFQYTLPS